MAKPVREAMLISIQHHLDDSPGDADAGSLGRTCGSGTSAAAVMGSMWTCSFWLCSAQSTYIPGPTQISSLPKAGGRRGTAFLAATTTPTHRSVSNVPISKLL